MSAVNSSSDEKALHGVARFHADVTELLHSLDLGDHARPISCHEVVQREILPAIERLRAELARANQVIEDIRALADDLPSAGFKSIDDDYERGVLHAKDDIKRNLARILSGLSEHQEGDTNG